jgi:hypothetical protein
MAINFGRGKKTAEPEEAAPVTAAPIESTDLNAHLIKDIEAAATKRVTGALEVVDRRTGAKARLYLYEGGLYSIAIDGYSPAVPRRLEASGVLDEGRLDYLRGVARPGPTCVQQGWISVDALATIHQEYLLASLGAVLACEKVKVHMRKGEQANSYCTLPLPVGPLIESVRVRGQRLIGTWPGLSATGTPATTVLRATGAAIPASLALPEFAALRFAVDGHRTVDAVAEQVGFTRAETVHLASILATAGVLAATEEPAAVAPTDRFLVPEAFGSVTVRVPVPEPVPASEPEPVAVAAAVATASEPESEPAPAMPFPPVAVVAAVVLTDAEPEPEPEPEPETKPETKPEPQPEPQPATKPAPAAPSGAPVADDHVLLLRREVAEAEVTELREALAEAVLLEREAITRAGAIRARLREAEATLAGLGGGADDPSDPG